MLQSEQILMNFFVFYQFLQHHEQGIDWHYTLREVLADVFVDKNSDFDLDVADPLLFFLIIFNQACVQNQLAR